jgi:hypothetical protein
LFGLNFAVFVDAGETGFGEIFHPKILDVLFGIETGFFFNFNFNPKTLAVKAVLEPLGETPGVFITLKQIFESPAAGVVDTHGIVGGDGAINERKRFVGFIVLMKILGNEVIFIPPDQNFFFQFGKIRVGGQIFEIGHS